jgi:pimeloyl-ACP methyl ester carboxylesterase
MWRPSESANVSRDGAAHDMTASFEPKACFYDSQGLRLHYADWGNDTAPPLILLHGGRDHCRSWDRLARALQPHFHVMAADLRGHGDSDWAKGSSYHLLDHVYDLTRMKAAAGFGEATIVGHSFGGMISLAYAGTYPERVTRVAILDGVFLPAPPSVPIEQQMTRWIGQLDKASQAKARRYQTIEEAAARMTARNKRLTPELALHLASHGVKKNADGTYRWKFDEYQRVRAPYRITPEDFITLWQRITCPTLLLCAGESFISNPAVAGVLKHFGHATVKSITGAGHWLQHDKHDEVLAELQSFFAAAG